MNANHDSKINKKQRILFFRLIFLVTGFLSTLWFLIRVIPKPSRVSYPCMRATFPIMTGFILYMISIISSLWFFKKTIAFYKKSRYLIAFMFFILTATFIYFSFIQEGSFRKIQAAIIEPSDAHNSPIGTGVGINPGRVVWIMDSMATQKNFRNGTYFFTPENNNEMVYHKMFRESILKLTNKSSLTDGWVALFKYFNKRKKNQEVGYQNNEIIFIKINQGTISWTCSESTGWDFSKSSNKFNAGACQANPYTVLALLAQLVDTLGIPQNNIFIADPISHIMKQHYDLWKSRYPNIKYGDKSSTSVSKWGRTKLNVSDKTVIKYSDKGTVMKDAVTDKIYLEMETANYIINIAHLKGHVRAGVTLCAKNHFGSHWRDGAWHLHSSLVSPVSESDPTNNEYFQYRVFVDIMGSKYLGQNTILFVVDGIYGGDYHELYPPRKWNMPPFNGDWCNSLFVSQDQVALESVCFDFLRTEYNGVYNNNTNPNWGAVDDYLHQAASSQNWPSGIIYDPDDSGNPIGSLGVHEHWNNSIDKKYSKNLNIGNGIELITVINPSNPDSSDTTLVSVPKINIDLFQDFNIYPNPCAKILNILIRPLTAVNAEIKVISLEGKIMISRQINLYEKEHILNIDLSKLYSNTYILHIKLFNSIYASTKSIKFNKI